MAGPSHSQPQLVDDTAAATNRHILVGSHLDNATVHQIPSNSCTQGIGVGNTRLNYGY